MGANELSGRRALVISPSFFGYEVAICEELERQGFDVVFADERPSNSAVMRAAVRLRKQLLVGRVERYYEKLADDLCRMHFDLVLVIKAEVVTRSLLQALRERNPAAHFVLYTYDSLRNAPNCLELMPLFNRRISFDPDDVESRADLEYLPLFYTNEFEPAPDEAVRHQVSFVGTLHSDRYNFAREYASEASDYKFFYVQASWYFFLRKYIMRTFSNVPWSEVCFSPLSRQEAAEVFRTSHVVLDMQRRDQSGLTMRTFEVLASGSCLATTNEAIRKAPFYDPARVLIMSYPASPEQLASARDALRKMRRHDAAPEGFERFSIRAWVEEIVAPRQVDTPNDSFSAFRESGESG